jgi:hypothetical protein
VIHDYLQVNGHRVTDLGAVADGRTLVTHALQSGIDRVHEEGGGTLYFPPGIYLTGSLELRSNVTLDLEANAIILASSNRADYRHDCNDCFIYGREAHRAAIRGRGVIDGSGSAFWKRAGNGRFTKGDWRPTKMLQFYRCDDLLIEGVTIRNSPSWTIHPIDCDGAVIHGITILNGIYGEAGPNTDGIDPDGCTNMRISDCFLQCSDDCVVIKITKQSERRECRDITVTNCVLVSMQTALKIGSETNGEFRNITFSNCAIKDAGCGIGLWMRDGGIIDGWTVCNVAMSLPKGGVPIYMWSFMRFDGDALEPVGGSPMPEKVSGGRVRNVLISDVIAEGDGGVFMSGTADGYLEGIVLDNVRILMRGATDKPMSANPPLPFPVWGHHRAPYDIFCRYVRDLRLSNVRMAWGHPEKAEWGSAARFWHVEELTLEGFEARQAKGTDQPVVDMCDVRGAFVRGCRPLQGAGAFLGLRDASREVTIVGNDLRRAAQPYRVDTSSEEPFECGNRLPDS